MNVSCTSCSAKYGIPDEKVRGKKVKITCKHCGTAIVVDGTTLDAPAAAGAPAAAPVALAASPAPKPAPVEPELSFDIAYPDDRQETLPLSELVTKYAAGTLTDEAFVWREGMTEWKAPREVPEIAAALGARGLAPKAAAAPKPAVSYDEDEATKIQVSPFDSLSDEASGEWREPAKEAPSSPQAAFDLRAPSAAAAAAGNPAPSPKPAGATPVKTDAAKPAAARRSAARGGGDLFGDLAAAGSEEDESLGTDAKDVGPKLTGARNESSVLFSLDALVKQEQKPAPKKAAPKQDDAAAFLMGNDSSPNSIANVGTGSFGSAFAAPDFSAPITAPPDARGSDAMDGGGASKKRGGMWLALVAVLIIGGGAAAMVLTGKLAVTPPPPPAPSTTEAATKPEAKPEVTPASSQDAPTATASASGTPESSAATSPPSGGAASATGGGPSTAAATTKSDEVASKPAEKPAERPAEKPAEKPTEKPAEAASAAPPFDTAAAKTALGAAAGNAGSCKTADGPTGGGKVSVTFMPSGRATNTQVSGDLAGTAVGGCVARLFRTAKVPAFSGDPVTVSKSFSIQ
jgi:predicted Zn finger-like uncharacterized protein